MSALLSSSSVQRDRAVLAAHGLEDRIVELAAIARTAEDAARACGVPVGAIVKSLVFAIDQPSSWPWSPAPPLDLAALPTALGLPGAARRCDADTVRAVTGFAIGGVAPIGHWAPYPSPSIRASPVSRCSTPLPVTPTACSPPTSPSFSP